MNEKLTEEYWRVSFDTAKLLKEAAFDCEVHCYTWPDGLNEDKTFYSNKALNYNADPEKPFEPRISIPLISVAVEWCKDLGYADGCFDYMYVITYKGKTLKAVDMSTPEYPEQDRQQLFYFIQACCKHRIEQLKP